MLVPLHTGNLETYPKIWIGPKLSKYTKLAVFVRQIMAIPFLPCDLIYSTYSCLQSPKLQPIENCKLDDFLKYFKKYWLNQIKPNVLSIFELKTLQIMEQKATMQD